MIICEVIGHVWATKKEDTLTGLKLMVVEQIDALTGKRSNVHVAADVVGERVLVVSGSTARMALGRNDVAADCAIVGIIDSLEVQKHK